ncbi:helix-turn-helix domain-containing protein [Candidatus Stoquefichus sp. SB1]|uniref:helix-turn-helix domain-containing protein n=1 Tax=Candidatus Stoquefichus sp. SB1 TaxID=1658109 RepID=UPI00067EB6B8|nr:helix-turn-helix transcriptional regulator [Candidatus Stoquefichus sp. SB1]
MKYEIFLKRMGKSIRIIRKSKKLKQEDLAKLCGVNQNYISDIENGKRNITMLKIFDIAEALNI